MKDSAQSFEQKKWESEVAEYERMKMWLKDYSHRPSMKTYAEARIADFCKKYPQHC